MRRLLSISLGVGLAVLLVPQSAPAPPGETGSKRCSDGIDNDGDGLIDSSDPDCNEGGGSGGGGGGSEDPPAVTLEATVEFGFTPVDRVDSTIGPFEAVVECGAHFCELNALIPAPNNVLGLPPSVAGVGGIIDSTEWRGTPLDGPLCYDFDKSDAFSNLELIDVSMFLRVYDDPSQGWFMGFNGVACDMDSTASLCDERQYTKRFRGECPTGGCDPLDFPNVGDMSAYDGSYFNTWSSGPDKKLGIPCRCTMSNSPDCPDEVGLPIPPVMVTVERVP